VKVDLTREPSFTGDVQVSLSNPPEGVAGDVLIFTADLATEGFELRVGAGVPLGNLALTFTASGGGATTTAALTLDVQPAEPTSLQLIQTALQAGNIDLATSLLYRCYARVGDELLPEAFRGSGGEEDLTLPDDIDQATPQLSAAALAALRPYTVRPNHPDSVYAQALPLPLRSAERASDTAEAPPPEDCSGGNVWRSQRSALVPVRVWTECGGSESTAASSMQRVLSAFEKFWQPMTSLMALAPVDAGGEDEGGDDAIDVYLVQGGITRGSQTHDAYRLINLTALAYAQTSPTYGTNSAGKRTASGYIVLPRIGVMGERRRATLTHEFFHVLQFGHHWLRGLSTGGSGYWFTEASATWAAVHFDRALRWPARVGRELHVERFSEYQGAIKGLSDPMGTHKYASYIWPFFAEQVTGSNQIVAAMWRGLERAGSAAEADDILNGQFSFAQNFHKFAVKNYNEEFTPGDPLPKAERYVTLDDLFPDKQYPPHRFSGRPGNFRQGINLPPLSAAYVLLVPSNGTVVRKVELDFTGLQPSSALDVDALIMPDRNDARWLSKVLSFTGQPRVVFCFDRGKSTETVRGAFDTLELALSNHAHAPGTSIIGDFLATGSEVPCGVWDGTTSVTVSYTNPAGTVSITTTADVAFEFDPEAPSSDAEFPYRVQRGAYQYDYLLRNTGRTPPCRTIQRAIGNMHRAPIGDTSPGATFAELRIFRDFSPMEYVGSGQTMATVTQTTNCNDTNTDETTELPNQVIVWWSTAGQTHPLSPDGLTASGSATSPSGQGGDYQYEWSFTKREE